MKKELFKQGENLVLKFDAEDQKLLNLEVGDVIDLLKWDVYGIKGKIKEDKLRKNEN